MRTFIIGSKELSVKILETLIEQGHEVLGVKMTAKIFNRLKLPLNDKMKFVQYKLSP